MTKAEAIVQMEKGIKMTHKYFTPEEWVYIGANGLYVLEDGVECTPSEFWKWRQNEYWNADWNFWQK